MRAILLSVLLGLSSPCLAGSWVLVDQREPVSFFYVDDAGVITDPDGAIIGTSDAAGFSFGGYAGRELVGDRVHCWRVSDNKSFQVFTQTEWGRFQESLTFFWVAGFGVGAFLTSAMGYVFLKRGVMP